MEPAEYELKIRQGKTLSLEITWSDEDGAVVALSGYSARLQIRETLVATAFLVEMTDENGGIALADTAPNITLSLSATATAAMTWKRGVYDLEVESPGGFVTPLLEGPAILVYEVTR